MESIKNIEDHIHRLTETLNSLKKDLPAGSRYGQANYAADCYAPTLGENQGLRHRRVDHSADYDAPSSEEGQDTPPKLRPYDETCSDHKPAVHNTETKPARRKEIEARRYNGKESVDDYLLQFDLTARRNQWSDEEKASALLCALDGPARQILQELDDPATAGFKEICTALSRRFGPTDLTEVHEQTLQQIKLAKNQNIREMASEVQRLTKLAYPDIIGRTRDRMAVKHLIRGIPDRDVAFYIKEKDPDTISEVCTMYERYNALNSDEPPRKASVKGVKDPDADPGRDQVTQQQLTAALAQAAETTGQQIQQLINAIGRLGQPQQPSPAVPPPLMPPPGPRQAPPPHESGPMPRPNSTGNLPRTPRPRCKQPGHWARDCNLPETCFRCGQTGHRRRDCQTPLNPDGPALAPHSGPQAPRLQ